MKTYIHSRYVYLKLVNFTTSTHHHLNYFADGIFYQDANKIPYLTYFTAVDLKRNFKGFNYIANRIRKIAKDFKGKNIILNIHTQSIVHISII